MELTCGRCESGPNLTLQHSYENTEWPNYRSNYTPNIIMGPNMLYLGGKNTTLWQKVNKIVHWAGYDIVGIIPILILDVQILRINNKCSGKCTNI